MILLLLLILSFSLIAGYLFKEKKFVESFINLLLSLILLNAINMEYQKIKNDNIELKKVTNEKNVNNTK